MKLVLILILILGVIYGLSLEVLKARNIKSDLDHDLDHDGPWFPIWGVYCGLWHTSHYGVEPVDKLDRYCQFHDICVTMESQGYRSCWCNEQLYYSVSNVIPQNSTESEIKDSILYYIYMATADCANHWGFDDHIKLTRVRPDIDERGYNYLPFYPSSIKYKFEIALNTTNGPANRSHEKIKFQDYAPSLLFKLDATEYNEFVQQVHENPISNIVNYTKNIVNVLSYDKFIFENQDSYFVIYNTDQNNDMTYIVKNITSCCDCPETKHKIDHKINMNLALGIGVGVPMLCVIFLVLLFFVGLILSYLRVCWRSN